MTQSIDRQTKIAGRDYTLRFSWKAVAALGDLWGCKTPDETLTKLGEMQKQKNLDIKSGADLLWASLRTHHAEISRDQIDDMIDEHGVFDFPAIVADLSVAIAGAQPPAEGKKSPLAKNPRN